MTEPGSGINWSKPIGPLPTGAWAAIVVGMVGLAYWNRKKAAAVPATVTDTSGVPGVGTGGWIATTQPLNDPSTQPAGPTTNDAWAQQCITWLIGQGYEPTIADAAIRNYINGQNLTVQQQALVDVALKHFGAPPETLTPPLTNPTPITDPTPKPPPVPTPTPTPTPKPPPPPPKPVPPPPPPPPPQQLRYVIVTPWPGTPYDSLAKIARQFYGSDNAWPTLFNANRAGFVRPDGSVGWVNDPALIYAGRSIWVP